MKPIPDKILDEALALAATPAKRLQDYTAPIYHAVADLKAAKRTKADATDAWEWLKSVLDDAVQENQLGVFDDLAKAWEKVEVESISITLTEGKTVHKITQGEITNSPRQPIACAMIQAIRNIQKGRAPTRQEIVSEMAKRGTAIDDSELCKQLKKLGWQGMIHPMR